MKDGAPIDEHEAARIAQTEALFREVNERIAETAWRFEAGEASFVCECADRTCTHRVDATMEEYEDVRSDATQFLLAPGHDDERVERVVERRKGHDVVAKIERRIAAAVQRLDPRAEAV